MSTLITVNRQHVSAAEYVQTYEEIDAGVASQLGKLAQEGIEPGRLVVRIVVDADDVPW